MTLQTTIQINISAIALLFLSIGCGGDECDLDSPISCDRSNGYSFCRYDENVNHTVLAKRDCSAPYQCIDNEEFDLPQCVFDGLEYPACIGSGHVCEAELAINCIGTFRRGHKTCIGCEIGSDGFANCEQRGIGYSCDETQDCPEPSECTLMPNSENSRCTISCDCDDATVPCSDCSSLKYPNACVSNVCI